MNTGGKPSRHDCVCRRSPHAGSDAYPGARIPDWAYRDVLYLLIDYSERAYQLLHRPLTRAGQQELYEVFACVGAELHIPALPTSYAEWCLDRQLHYAGAV